MASSSQLAPADSLGLKILELSKKRIPAMVLIFNHKDYYDVNLERKGTEHDVESLKQTFNESLGFKVQVCNDLTIDEIKEVINEYAKNKSYEECGSLFIFVLTHGMSYGMLLAKDDWYHINKLWGPLKASEALKGIPKLFFIQACRNFGHTPDDDLSKYEQRYEVSVQNDAASINTTYWFPHAKDFFFAFSTVPGKVSNRNIEEGTWFIQSLCGYFKHVMLDGKGDLLSAMTKVIDEVSNEIRTGKIIITCQTPVYGSALDCKICYRNVADASDELFMYEIPEEAPGKTYIIYEEKLKNEMESLTCLFETLHFDVTSSQVSSNENLLETLHEISSTVRDSASLILVFLTSLGEHTLRNFGITFEECKNYFLASNCEAMRSKPKIFMFLDIEDIKVLYRTDGVASSVPKFCNDHSDMMQITCYHRGSLERLEVCLQILSFRRANITELLTKVLISEDKSTRGYLSYFESSLRKAIYLGPSSMESEATHVLIENIRTKENVLKTHKSKESAAILKLEMLKMTCKLNNRDELKIIEKKLKTAKYYFSDKLHEQALKLLKESLESQRRILGDEHVNTLFTMHNMADTLRELGRHKEALTLFEECLENRRHVLGDEHEDTLNAMHNMADTLRELERNEEALTLFEECLKNRRHVLGDEHVNTMNTMFSKAFTLRKLGRNEEALTLYDECLKNRHCVLGDEHVNTLDTIHNKAFTLKKLLRHQEALTLYEECLEKRRRVLGDEHEDTLITMCNKADTLKELGGYNNAISLLDDCLEKCHRVLGNEHKITLSTMHIKASTLRKLERHKESLTLFDECLEKRHRVLGDEHEDTLSTMHSKALTLGKLERDEEALTLNDECLEKRRRVLGDEHEDTFETMSNKAFTLRKLGRNKEALTLYEECLEKRRRVLGDEHKDTLITMHNKAFTLGQLGRHKEALTLYEECLEKRRRVLGDEHKDTLITMHNKAFTLRKLERNEEALTLYEECLEKRRRVLGDEHVNTMKTMFIKAFTLGKLGRREEALTLYEECLENRRRVLGEEHEDTLLTMSNRDKTLRCIKYPLIANSVRALKYFGIGYR